MCLCNINTWGTEAIASTMHVLKPFCESYLHNFSQLSMAFQIKISQMRAKEKSVTSMSIWAYVVRSASFPKM